MIRACSSALRSDAVSERACVPAPTRQVQQYAPYPSRDAWPAPQPGNVIRRFADATRGSKTGDV
jgi:hypothetical protein